MARRQAGRRLGWRLLSSRRHGAWGGRSAEHQPRALARLHSCRSRRSGAGSARMLPIIIAILPPRISAGGLPLSRTASIRTLAPSPTDFGSKITSTLMKKNYASQSRRGLAPGGGLPVPPPRLSARQHNRLGPLTFAPNCPCLRACRDAPPPALGGGPPALPPRLPERRRNRLEP